MTRQHDILAAQALGIDFIGFVFVPFSPRCISFSAAEKVRCTIQHANVVGVFSDHSDEEIDMHADELGLDYIQLHRKPDIDCISSFSKPVIQAFCGVPDVKTLEAFLTRCPFVLIDKAYGEDEINVRAIAHLPSTIRSKLFVAGGLTPENVRMVIDLVEPYAVDCARGIESQPGRKDHCRMHSFFHALL